MRVTIYGPNLPRELSDKGDIVAHRWDCVDSVRSTAETLEVTSIEDIVDAVYGGFGEYEGTDEMDAYAGYRGGIYVFPCVDLPEHGPVFPPIPPPAPEPELTPVDIEPHGWMIRHSRATDTMYFGPFGTIDEAQDWIGEVGRPEGVRGILLPLYRDVDWSRTS